MGSKTMLVVSPHPDDEVLGMGATQDLLLSHGWLMHNLACTLGRQEDRVRRLSELTKAGNRLGFETTLMEPLAQISRTDNLQDAVRAISCEIEVLLNRYDPEIVISPHTWDGHHGHETVAQALRETLERHPDGPIWWQYAIWADLPKPTLYVPYADQTLDRVKHAINAYSGENERSHYDLMYPARAIVARTLGSERVFGFGTGVASEMPYADLVTEVRFTRSGWRIAEPRVLDPTSPLRAIWGQSSINWWLTQPSPRKVWSVRHDDFITTSLALAVGDIE